MNEIMQIEKDLSAFIKEENISNLKRFFKTSPGEYGEGDVFLGVKVPDIRKVVKLYNKKLSLEIIEILLHNKYHEIRMLSLFILVDQFKKGNEKLRKKIVELYLRNTDFINNWDLVDSSAHKILGFYLMDKSDRNMLYKLAQTNHLWNQRIAIIATFWFIKQMQFDDTIKISLILLNHKHDLIHKAVGWMLREIGNRHKPTLVNFLNIYYSKMPRTMLRYSIEKFPKEERMKYLKGEI